MIFPSKLRKALDCLVVALMVGLVLIPMAIPVLIVMLPSDLFYWLTGPERSGSEHTASG